MKQIKMTQITAVFVLLIALISLLGGCSNRLSEKGEVEQKTTNSKKTDEKVVSSEKTQKKYQSVELCDLYYDADRMIGTPVRVGGFTNHSNQGDKKIVFDKDDYGNAKNFTLEFPADPSFLVNIGLLCRVVVYGELYKNDYNTIILKADTIEYIDDELKNTSYWHGSAKLINTVSGITEEDAKMFSNEYEFVATMISDTKAQIDGTGQVVNVGYVSGLSKGDSAKFLISNIKFQRTDGSITNCDVLKSAKIALTKKP